MKTYTGTGTNGIVTIWKDGVRTGAIRRHERNPTGIALALLTNAYDYTTAIASYQAFRSEWVAKLKPDEHWEINDDEIRKIVANLGDD